MGNGMWSMLALGSLLGLGMGVAVAAVAANTDEVEDREVVCPPPVEGVERLARALSARERTVESRERELEQDLLTLREVEADIDAKNERLQTLIDEINEKIDGLDDEEAARVKGLAKKVEAMKSKNAAAMFSDLFQREPDKAIAVLNRMATDKAGKMMSALEPALASRVASKAAERMEPKLP